VITVRGPSDHHLPRGLVTVSSQLDRAQTRDVVNAPSVSCYLGDEGSPAKRQLTIRRILGGDDIWVSECLITYDGMPIYSLSIMGITGGLVTRETQYLADPFQAAPGRAGLAEAIPPRDQG
jgi:hypothetical protein